MDFDGLVQRVRDLAQKGEAAADLAAQVKALQVPPLLLITASVTAVTVA